MKLDNFYHLEYQTHGTMDIAIWLKVLLSEIIWRLQVQSQLQVKNKKTKQRILTRA